MMNLRIIGSGVLVGALLLVGSLPLRAAPPQAAPKQEKPKKPTVKVDTDVYSGAIQTIDLPTLSLVVKGKLLQRTIELRVGQKYTAPPQTMAVKKLARGTALGTFAVSPSCKVSAAGRSAVFLKDLKVGDLVEVTFREINDGKFVADRITLVPPTPATKPTK